MAAWSSTCRPGSRSSTRSARIDGSVGWIAMIGNDRAHLRRLAAARDLRADLRKRPGRRSFAAQPSRPGRPRPSRSGWRVNGRWPFASGCQHADWIFGVLRHDRGRQAPAGTDRRGGPLMRGFFLPARGLADRGHLARRRAQGYRQPSRRTPGQDRPDGEFLRSRERGTVPAGTALSDRAAAASDVARRVLRRHGARGAGRTPRACQHRPAATARRRADAGVGTFQGELGRIAAELRAARHFFRSKRRAIGAMRWRER